MKTLYEILEVSETASQEIIEKAYKVLAKKYHPDLQPEGEKQKAEQTMKQINEAYSILSDEIKRKSYDEELKVQREQEKQSKSNQTNSNEQEQIIEEYYQRTMQNEMKANQENAKIRQEVKKQYERQYQQAYENYLRSLGYKIKYKWTWKNFKDLLITILIIVAICAILWFLPPTHKLIIEFYESNIIVKNVVDVLGSVIIGIWNGICSIF